MIEFFQKVIYSLEKEKISYMLSGSLAMGIYVVPRATRDFDFVIQLNENDILKFASNFKVGYYCNEESIFDAVKHHSMFNIIDHESGYKADFIVLKNEIYRKTEFERRQRIMFFEKEVFVVSVEDLILSKLIWIQDFPSIMQKNDLEQLLELESLDKVYLQKWVSDLKLNTYNLPKIFQK